MDRQNPNRSLLRDGHALSVYGLKLADVCVVAATGVLAHALRFGGADLLEPARYLYAVLAGVLLTLVAFSELGVYRTWRSGLQAAMYGRLLLGWGVVLGVLASISFLSKTGTGFSRLWFAYWAGLGLFSLIATRLLVRRFLRMLNRQGIGVRNVVLVGPIACIQTVRDRLARNPASGLRCVGEWVDPGERAVGHNAPEEAKIETNSSPVDTFSSLDALVKWIENTDVHEVWLTWPMRNEEEIRRSMEALQDTSVNIRWVPDFFSFRMVNHGVTEMAGLPMYDLSVSPLSGINLIVKQVEDRVLAALILLLLSPIMLVLALAVKLSSPGPVFYRQERVGWNNKPFMMLKFRSMPVDSEVTGVRWGGAKDKKVTPFGSFIRKTSLDELPQFINVLTGDMSIVGPRPERTVFVRQFKDTIPNYMKKHMVKAGITGWAQINGLRGDTDLAKRVEYDLLYIEHWSVWFDLRIIAQTALKVFFDRSAY